MQINNLWLIAGVITAATTPLASAANESNEHPPIIAPIHSSPGGQTYGRWAVQWQQYVYGVPAAFNPLNDPTGNNCAQNQVGNVWFLTGLNSGGTVVRDNCKIPAGKSLFFPLINTGYGAFLNDAPDTRTERYIRAAGSCTEPTQISVNIDGFDVLNPTQYFTGKFGSQSPFFNIQLPPSNVFGADETIIPQLLLSPSSEQGYYLFVKPLSVGPHIIHWVASGCTSGGYQNITYHLTVLGNPMNH